MKTSRSGIGALRMMVAEDKPKYEILHNRLKICPRIKNLVRVYDTYFGTVWSCFYLSRRMLAVHLQTSRSCMGALEMVADNIPTWKTHQNPEEHSTSVKNVFRVSHPCFRMVWSPFYS